MNRKLLYKTQRIYLIYSAVVLMIMSPLFYLLIHRMYISNADESLRLREYEFRNNNISTLRKKDISVWNKYNPDVKILKDKGLKGDTLFYSHYYETQDNETELYRELNTPVIIDNEPYTLSARMNLVESEDLILGIALLFIVIMILLLVGLFVINRRLSGRLWKPFYHTLQEIEEFEIDRYHPPRFATSDIEEFNRLNSSIERLIRKNIAIYNSHQEFIENAAHELQTPIAVFKAKIDTLIQRSDITRGQAGILTSLNETVARLERLNKNLLLLSKIEREQFHTEEEISIEELLKKLLDFFIEQAEQKEIEIRYAFRNDVTVNAHGGLTEIMLSNLLMNAVRHNVKKGVVKITLSEKTLTITNTGKPAPLSEENLFRRFSRTDKTTPGNGLGLAIVKKIADLNVWTVSYSFAEDMHTFSVSF